MPKLTIKSAFDLALQHHQRGQLQEAEQLYRQILTQQPQHVDAIHNLGVLARQSGRNDLAVDFFHRALAIDPNLPEAYSNLGNALKDQGHLDDAIIAYRRAIAQKPDYAEAYHNLGHALQIKGHIDDAIAADRQAIALKPDFPEAHSNLGNALTERGFFEQAIAAYRRAIALNPNDAQTRNNLGNALRSMGFFDEAVAASSSALALKPNFAAAFNNLGNALKGRGQMGEAIAAYHRAIELCPNFLEAHSNLLLSLHYHPAYGPHEIAQAHQRWNLRQTDRLLKISQVPSATSGHTHSNDRNPERRLRIGYVSPDFREHVVGRNLLPLFLYRNQRDYGITCYAQVSRPDAVTGQFQRLVDHWRSTVGLSDDQAEKQIREDQIDILVDLALHSANNRLPIFVSKPAPVQATFAGYPGTTGLSAIDYRLSDPYLDPPGSDASNYSEKTVRLADSFWCYDPMKGRQVSINPLPALEKGFITFGCLNNFCKINDAILATWARVLAHMPNSKLLLLAPEGSHRQRTNDRLAHEGIDPNRIEFASRRSHRDYLELYHRIDIGLDSFPYNGHTTSLDSFWMGVPVITLAGQTPVSRAGWSQLSNLGLQDLAAQNSEQFVKIAVDLAQDLQRLRSVRSTLRQRMEQSPLMDAPKFARSVEAAYRQMWRSWCEASSSVS